MELPVLSVDACAGAEPAAGNPVLAKHASIVPHCAETFAHLVREAGAPDGAWTNLFISSDQVSNIIADPRVQGAALTGSESGERRGGTGGEAH